MGGMPRQEDLQGARERFCMRLQNYAARKRVGLEVVFDSSEDGYFPSVFSKNGLKITFCSDADDYIRNVVRGSHSPASILVVSSDGEITSDVRRRGAKVKSPAEFDAFLSRSASPRKVEPADDEKPSPESISAGEVNAWLEEFRNRK
jgi:predicted RNA-binding protein with PIN domain